MTDSQKTNKQLNIKINENELKRIIEVLKQYWSIKKINKDDKELEKEIQSNNYNFKLLALCEKKDEDIDSKEDEFFIAYDIDNKKITFIYIMNSMVYDYKLEDFIPESQLIKDYEFHYKGEIIDISLSRDFDKNKMQYSYSWDDNLSTTESGYKTLKEALEAAKTYQKENWVDF